MTNRTNEFQFTIFNFIWISCTFIAKESIRTCVLVRSDLTLPAVKAFGTQRTVIGCCFDSSCITICSSKTWHRYIACRWTKMTWWTEIDKCATVHSRSTTGRCSSTFTKVSIITFYTGCSAASAVVAHRTWCWHNTSSSTFETSWTFSNSECFATCTCSLINCNFSCFIQRNSYCCITVRWLSTDETVIPSGT